jgi:hypothetical protein
MEKSKGIEAMANNLSTTSRDPTLIRNSLSEWIVSETVTFVNATGRSKVVFPFVLFFGFLFVKNHVAWR